ncbi:ABC-2 type transport system permease protein [Prauserella marina]|uniref:Transport permease protein n=1 Tax=Prauserella marina TaxID=530584 RepID=A0A1G6LKI6_9PSEU|nr:ABC transporter permease [Prauserella marina]PWV85879.1 ABC-2 type transport system permease protein [Prauserella marina]SDC43275.1 ABC-2 type transport system permease protein [Prauserella marina]
MNTAMATGAARRGARGLTTELIFTKRSVIHSLRNLDSLVTAVVAPVAIMLLFVTVFGAALDTTVGGAYADYVTPGVMLLCAGFGAALTATSIHTDVSKGFIERLRTMPIRASGVIFGHVFASLLRNLGSTVIVMFVAVALGFRPTASPAEWLGIAALLVAYILVFTLIAAAWGLAATSADSAGMFSFVALFLPYLSTAFIPVGNLPGFLRGFAENQPLTLVIEALRGLATGNPDQHTLVLSAVWLLGLGVAATVLTTMLFRRAARS